MNREELIAYDKWLTRRKWGTGEIISPEKAADIYLAEHPLPPAEGAVQHLTDEEYQKPANQNRDHPIIGYKSVEHEQQPTAEGAEEYLKQNHISGADFVYTTGFRNMVDIMEEFATIHAQRLADKMVSERLREEPIAFLDKRDHTITLSRLGNIEAVDLYLKPRE